MLNNVVCVLAFYPQNQLSDIRGMVPYALQIRHHLEGSGYLAQVAGNRLLAQYQGQASGLDGPLHIIDGPVALNHILSHRIILVLKCHEGLLNSALHHMGHFF